MKFIIDFKNHLTQEDIDAHIADIGGSVIKTFLVSEKTYLVDCPTPPEFNSELHEHVINDEESPLRLLATTTVMSDQTWGTKQLTGPVLEISTTDPKDWWKNYSVLHPEFDAPSYSIDKRGTGYTVYVLDSGCELTHPEFVGRPVSNLFAFNGDFTDINGHGTAITSVIAGNTCGVTDATVKAVKIFDNRQPTLQSDLVNALDAIHSDFIANHMSFAVINCSWAISKNTFIESKLQALINMGMAVIVAAGNSGMPIADVTPASMSTAVTVGSYNDSFLPSNFSDYTSSDISVTTNTTNHGALDGWAPGENIYTATLNGGYGFVSGTSIAAGIMSAISAYNLTLFPFLENSLIPKAERIANHSFMRYNMLDLSDPKYASSKNRIATLKDYIDARAEEHRMGTISQATAGTAHHMRVFEPRHTYKIEILSDLPAGFSIDEVGILNGIAPAVTEVTKEVIPAILYDLNQEAFPFNITIINIPDGWNTDTDTTGDPVLDIQLKIPAPCAGFPCEPIDGCLDNCWDTYGTTCDTYQDKACTLMRCSCTPY